MIGTLASATTTYAQPGLQMYGTDLGCPFEHRGRVLILFGDSYAKVDAACDLGNEVDDDSVGIMPAHFDGHAPALEFFTRPDDPSAFRNIQLFRGSEKITLNAFHVPVGGFSTGDHAYGLFQIQRTIQCDTHAATGCPALAGVRCIPDILACDPAPVTVPHSCELQQLLCVVGQCPDMTALCVDTQSSQYDGSARGNAASVLSEVEFGRARDDDETTFDSVATWTSNRFSHPVVRAVKQFTGKRAGNDYTTGTESLLMWGRPGMYAEEGRESRLYFAEQPLPIENGFKPRYFTGLDPESGEPIWSEDAAAAAPLPLDGQNNGDPHEEVSLLGTTTVSWLGAPINRWVMMYGGDAADFLLATPYNTRGTRFPGAVMIRFAEHPWGPWSPAQPHLLPGSPHTVGAASGPGGILYNRDCVSQPNAACAPNDAHALSALNMCVQGATSEPGRLYAPTMIESYTQPNASGGLDFSWLVSTWVPYGVVLMTTSIVPQVMDTEGVPLPR